MASSQKKVIVRNFNGELAWGYLPQADFLLPAGLPLMQVDGKIKSITFSDIKTIAYVRDFNRDDLHDPERLGRRTFLSRPRGDGLWLRLELRDGDLLEGLSSFDLGFLDSLLHDQGLFLTPPDGRSNTLKLFLPRAAIRSIDLLGLVQSPSRRLAARKPSLPRPEAQPGLFGDPGAE